jgi:hypothetical protein
VVGAAVVGAAVVGAAVVGAELGEALVVGAAVVGAAVRGGAVVDVVVGTDVAPLVWGGPDLTGRDFGCTGLTTHHCPKMSFTLPLISPAFLSPMNRYSGMPM